MRQNNLDGVRQLLQAGATVDASDRRIWTPLHLATRYGNVDIVRLLLESGAYINRRGFHGWTAADAARGLDVGEAFGRRENPHKTEVPSVNLSFLRSVPVKITMLSKDRVLQLCLGFSAARLVYQS